ncbi:MAG: 2-amino-4-hydroxy-6-hydroxymethyldihydropteridine diphosphokinase [Opitutales bacterium]|nr:2-amino-4-hydroxy-6-hydroxymethyldihydropteridine diphosphokinase [Opitutales bacterium]
MESRGQSEPVLVAFGSNLGNREENLQLALQKLTECADVSSLHPSSLRETEPVGYADQPRFLNGAVFFSFRGSVQELLGLLQSIEKSAGKATPFPNGPRTLDLDIIFFGSLRHTSPGLTVPHPRWAERAFVVEPLQEIAQALPAETFPPEWKTEIAAATQKLQA